METTLRESEISLPTPFTDIGLTRLWEEGLRADTRYNDIRIAIIQRERRFPTDLHLPISISECSIDTNGRTCWRGRIWIPEYEPLRTGILQYHHDSPLGGHPGRDALKNQVGRQFHWPGISQDVRKFVRNCDICGRTNIWREKRRGLLKPLPIPSRPWSEISLDFITSLPKSQSRGVKNILVVTDRLSKSLIFEPITEITAEATAHSLL